MTRADMLEALRGLQRQWANAFSKGDTAECRALDKKIHAVMASMVPR